MPSPTPKARLLVAEDEAPLRKLIEMSLLREQYEVVSASDGREALEKFRQAPTGFQMVILDVMMPYLDGFSVLQEIRKISEVPVLILTALGSSDDLVRGFAMGADDYVVKPFTFREVSARIEAILRRVAWMQQAAAPPPTTLQAGEIMLDHETHQVTVRGETCHMTPIEFMLLKYFMTHPHEVLGKAELFREVWGYEFEGSTNLVEVGVRRLREKIEADPSEPIYIRTVRGVGYRFQPPNPTS